MFLYHKSIRQTRRYLVGILEELIGKRLNNKDLLSTHKLDINALMKTRVNSLGPEEYYRLYI